MGISDRAEAWVDPICSPALNLHKLANTSSANESDREYRVYLPSNVTEPLPVVYAFHGATEDPVAWPDHARLTAFASLADVIIVAPVAQQVPGSDEKLVWYTGDNVTTKPGERLHHDDAKFIADLMVVIDAASCTSTKRFAIGYSSGAGMAMTLACLMSDKFRAVGGVGGAVFDTSCETAPVHRPLINIHNRNDQVVPFALAKLRVEKYAKRNRCTSVIKKWNSIWSPSYQHDHKCPAGSDVVFYELNIANPQLGAVGHAWPTQSNSGRNATREIFSFFGLL